MESDPCQPNLTTSLATRGWRIRFWLNIAIVGVAVGIAGGLLMQLLHLVEQSAWSVDQGTLLDATRRCSAVHRILMLSAAGLFISLSGLAIRTLFGRGGDVDTAIWFRSGQIPAISTVARAVQSVIAVGMGTSLGRESAIKQAGGAIASWLARVSSLTRAEQRVLVSCGVGAGMAAAYNVPVGGALFAVEVLLGSISLRIVMPALLCSVIATVSSWALLPSGPVYDVPEYPLSVPLVIWSLWAGPVLGLMTIPLVRLFAWADNNMPRSGVKAVVLPIVGLTMLGFVSVFFPELLGNGQNAVQLAFDAKFSFTLLLLLPALKLFSTAGCLVTGARGGLFTPTLMIGAMLGGFLGHIWDRFVPGASMGCCSVIGAAAFLAAASQAPVSALVLVLELTRHVDATMAPMLLAVSGAMLVARQIELESIYTARIRTSDESYPPVINTTFAHLISTDFHTISASQNYADLLHDYILGKLRSPVFVIDHEGILVGAMEMSIANLTQPADIPLDALKVSDRMTVVSAVKSNLSEQDVLSFLKQQNMDAPPVVDAVTGRLMGVVRKLK